MNDLHLYTKLGCPFAQRTATVLAAKGLGFQTTVIDVDNKPDWFLDLSPLSKVPVLRHGDETLVESLVINEYLEDVFPDRPLRPETPSDRARMRFWMLFDETRLTPSFYRMMLAKDADVRARHRARYQADLELFEAQGLAQASPYLLGDRLTLADITVITHLQRLPLLVRHRGVGAPAEGGPLAQWMETVNRHPAVKAATPDWDVIQEDMAPYIASTADGTTAKDMMVGA